MSFEPDAAQVPVLEHAEGNLLVTGSPGCGKTTLLRERFARLVEGGADPERVVLFALNRRAAREARDHLMRRLGRSLPDLPVFTVHGFAFRLLGRRFDQLGYAQPPEVLSAPEQYAAVREMLRGEEAEDWPRFRRLLDTSRFAREVADFCLRAQERLLSPDELDALIQGSGRTELGEMATFYRRYVDQQGMAGRTDFAGLLLQAVSLLRRGVAGDERYRHVLVDDYQDATHAASAIVAELARHAATTVVAADPAGHVFSYRGGSLEPLQRIEDSLPRLSRVALDRSHRIDARVLVPLESGEPDASGAPSDIRARLFVHPGEEVEAVADELLRARVDDDVPWEGMAVIVRRYGEYLTALRHALVRHGIPFVVVAEAAAVATEPANRPVLDLLRYVFRPELRDELLEPVLTSPVGGFDPHGLRALRREALRRDLSLREFVESELEAPEDLSAPLEAFRKLLRDLPAQGSSPDRAFLWLWSTHPAFRDLVASGARHRDLDALAALGDVLARFVERRPGATVEDYLDTLEGAEFGPDPWIPPEERRPHAARIISAHRAQGMEFEVALVAGCLEGEFPSLSHRYPLVDVEQLLAPRSGAERHRARLAEERALFRLAVSRARHRTVVYASHSASMRSPRTPSRFVERLGVAWETGADTILPVASLRSLEASLRRRLADGSAPAASRLAAAASLDEVGARPSGWWVGRTWTDPGTPLHQGELRTSYSRLSTLQNCGLQYLYGVELGLDPSSTHQMWLGKVVHAIIEDVNRGNLERSQEAVLAALDQVWEKGRFPNRAIERQRRRDAETMLRNWLAGEGVGPERSEQWFSFPIDGAVLRGRIDALFRGENGHLRVVDYKTGRWLPSQDEVQEDLQLAAYYLAVKRTPELSALGEPRMLQLAFILESRYKEAFAQRTVRPAQIDGYEAWAEQTIKELLHRVRSEDFAPDPQAECRFCAFKPICPRWPEGAEVQT
ncbi:MAG TPA: ATP-dependent DNA helicase [Actinomycetota bacterium]